MRRSALGLVVALSMCAAACPKPEISASLESPPPGEELPVEPGLRWGPDLLDRYLAYQKDAARAYRLPLPAVPAAEASRGQERLLAALKVQAQAVEKARSLHRLSRTELEELDGLVELFLKFREPLSDLPSLKALEKLHPPGNRLPPALREQLTQTLQAMEDARKEAQELPTLRSQYGAAVTELLLSKEAELRAGRDNLEAALLAQ